MIEKRYSKMMNHYRTSRTYCTGIYDNQNNRELQNSNQVITELNALNNENEQLKDALNQRTDQCDKYYKENEQLKLTNRLLLEEMKEIRDKLTVYLEIRKGDLND